MALLDFRTRSAQPLCSNQFKCRGNEWLDDVVEPTRTLPFDLLLWITLHDRTLKEWT